MWPFKKKKELEYLNRVHGYYRECKIDIVVNVDFYSTTGQVYFRVEGTTLDLSYAFSSLSEDNIEKNVIEMRSYLERYIENKLSQAVVIAKVKSLNL